MSLATKREEKTSKQTTLDARHWIPACPTEADECGGVGGVGGDDGNRRGGGGGGGGGADGAEGVSAGCAGCGRPIRDAFLLRVWPDLRFHAACLRCAECRAQLHEARSCFVRAGRTFCQRDYNRLFGVKCSRCSLGLSRTELVMRVRGRVYHLACFRCWACARRLLPGDEVSLRPAGELLCRAHSLPPPPHHHHHHHHHHNHHHSHQQQQQQQQQQQLNDAHLENNHHHPHHNHHHHHHHPHVHNQGHNHHNHHNHHHHHHHQERPVGVPSLRPDRAHRGPGEKRGPVPRASCGDLHMSGSGKASRVRTVLTERQLQTLRTCYAANPRPDALLKEQLVEMTGLSPRVIRVWFQNKRCKDKKRTLAGRHDGEPPSPDAKTCLQGLEGKALVARSPVTQDSEAEAEAAGAGGGYGGGGGGGAVAVRASPQPPSWRALAAFALRAQLQPLPSTRQAASLSDSGSCSDSSSASDVTLLPSHLPDTPTSLASDLCSES
ncbi:insulin gene enhancer protein ISL-2-like [Lampetra fluviatilis]